MIGLRDVLPEDLDAFFEHQVDQEAILMAAVPGRPDKAEFLTHWKTKYLENEKAYKKAILHDGELAGNLISWEEADGRRLVGYWLGRKFWGKGIAGRALPEFLALIPARPLHALTAKHNRASNRILEKNGFRIAREDAQFSKPHDREIEVLHWILEH